MPLFSIVIPTFNRANFIEKSIKSVVSQSFTDYELIIIDDGSTDNTRQTVRPFISPKIRYLYQKNQERSTARNNAIEAAKGTYVCFLDSDDFYLPNHLETFYQAIKTLKDQKAMLYSGNFELIEGQLIKKPLPSLVSKNPIKALLDYTVFPTCACIERSILKEFRFNPKNNVWEDTELWLKIATKYPIIQLDKHTCVWQMHPQSTTQQIERNLTKNDIKQDIEKKKNILQTYIDQQHIKQSEVNEFIAKNYYYYAHDSLKIFKTRQASHCLYQNVAGYPKNLYSKHTWALVKNILKAAFANH